MKKITIHKLLFPFILSNLNSLVFTLIMLLIIAVSGNLQAQCSKTAPYAENFDGSDWLAGSGSVNTGDAIDNCWSRNPVSGSYNYFWGTQNGSTYTGNTGPDKDNTSGSGNYLYVEANNGSATDGATFTSPSIDISALNNAELRFFYHMYGDDVVELRILVDDGSGFTEIDAINGEQQTDNTDPFKEKIVDLSSFSGNIEVQFEAIRGSADQGDIAIDDFEVKESAGTILLSTSPKNKEHGIATIDSIVLNFNQSVTQSQLAGAINIEGSESGPINGSIIGGGTSSLSFVPSAGFYPGEEVRVYLGDNLIDNSPQSFKFSVITNDLGTETLAYNSSIIDNNAELPYQLEAAELNNDGGRKLDIASVNGDDNEVVYYDQDGVKNVVSSLQVNGRHITVADIDQDGNVDLVTAAFTNDRVDWFENDGLGNFTLNNISTTNNSTTQVFVADTDGDLDMDIISNSRGDNEIYIHENDGSQNFTRKTIVSQSGLRPFNMDIGDLDQDGDIDIIVGGQTDDAFYVINNGSGNFTVNTLDVNSGTFGIKMVDMENDGDVDVVAAIYKDDEIVWFENDGSLNFTRHVILSNILEPRRAIPADMNGDGDMDIVYSASDDDVLGILNNDGNQNFTDNLIDTGLDFPIAVTPVDFNKDGEYEILVGLGLNQDQILLYERTTLGLDDAATSKLAVYPNPVTDHRFSLSGLAGNGDATIQLFDMTGKLVFTTTKSAENTMTIDIDQSLQTGVYQLQITQNQMQYQSTLIISE